MRAIYDTNNLVHVRGVKRKNIFFSSTILASINLTLILYYRMYEFWHMWVACGINTFISNYSYFDTKVLIH
jgi:hypothetical protein